MQQTNVKNVHEHRSVNKRIIVKRTPIAHLLSFHTTASTIVIIQAYTFITHLNPNDPYRGRTAPLNVAFYIFIQQIKVLNILNMVYTLRFFLFKMQFVS